MTRVAPTRVYRLVVSIPPEIDTPDYVPPVLLDAEEWERRPFRWPPRRQYLSVTSAQNRASLLRGWGAVVRIEVAAATEWTSWPWYYNDVPLGTSPRGAS